MTTAAIDYRVSCSRCGHSDEYSETHAETGERIDPASLVLRCDTCGARIAYGQLQPRAIVSPHPSDARFLYVQIGETSHLLDLQHAEGLARAILSLVPGAT